MSLSNETREEPIDAPQLRVEDSGARELSSHVFGRVGDTTDLTAMNSHTRGISSTSSLEISNPFTSTTFDFTASLGSPPRLGSTAGAQEVAGGRPRGGIDRSRIPEDLRDQIFGPPTDPALLRDGIVKITPTFPGTGRPALAGDADGTGFLINTKGDKGLSKPGEQLIATADHVIEDRQRSAYQLGANLFNDQPELSKDALAKKGEELLSGIDNTKAHAIFRSKRDYAGDELSYLQANFDKIQSVSKELDPKAKGITLDGLDEYRRRNTTIEVETAAGRFNATIANRDPGADVAVLRISKLTPEQQRTIGPNREFETDQLEMSQPVKSVGFKKTVESAIDGLDRLTELKDTTDSITVDKPLEKGMSGGPTFSKSFKVIGVNHATGTTFGAITPITELRPLLKEISEGKIKFRRSLD